MSNSGVARIIFISIYRESEARNNMHAYNLEYLILRRIYAYATWWGCFSIHIYISIFHCSEIILHRRVEFSQGLPECARIDAHAVGNQRQHSMASNIAESSLFSNFSMEMVTAYAYAVRWTCECYACIASAICYTCLLLSCSRSRTTDDCCWVNRHQAFFERHHPPLTMLHSIHHRQHAKRL